MPHTLTSLDEAKEQFYKDLSHFIKATLTSNKLIILWDFNTKGVLGPPSVGNVNSNGLLLLS